MNALQKIVKSAKQMQKARPSLKWADAIKKASAQYRADAKKPAKKVGQTHKDTKSHNVNIRVVSGVKKKLARKARPGKKARAGSVLLLERGERPGKKPERTYKVNRTAKGRYKKFTRIAGSNMPEYSDPDLARDILLVADSDSGLYFRRRQPIEKNLFRKYKKGTFDLQRSAKLWLYYINDADKLYNREFVDRKAKGYLLSVNDRKLLALEAANNFYQELLAGNEFN